MFNEIVAFLSTHCASENQRQMFVTLAFRDYPAVSRQIILTGAPQEFAAHLVNTLQTYGDLTPDKSALWHLLLIMRDNLGVNHHDTIKRFAPWANPSQVYSPSPAIRQKQEESALRGAEAEAQAAARQPSIQGRLIGSLRYRYDGNNPFYDRSTEQARIQACIQRGERLITIHARAGAGKTALACKVLSDLEHRADLVAGIVALTAGEIQRQVSLDRILSDFGRLLPEGALMYQTGDPASEKVAALLRALQGGRYVLLIDNLESLLDDNDALRDPDLQALLTGILEQGGLTLLVTTRHRPRLERPLRGYERAFPLDSGLPADEALQMLRGLDRSGLLSADDTLLHELSTRVRGFPRALEAAVGLLADSPTLTLPELLQDKTLFEGEVTKHIVEKALSTLPPLLMRVMEALALLGQPVSLAAVEYLLAPYVDWSGIKPRDVLDRLIDRRCVSYNPTTQRYSLHPLDRDYCEKCIHLGTPTDANGEPPVYTWYALNARAAQFFLAQRKPQHEWKSLADLEPQLSEFEYRIRLGDYSTVASLLSEFDFDCLLLWGHARLMAALHERLLSKVDEPYLKIGHLGNLGSAHYSLGDIRKAIAYYEQALAIAREVGDKGSEGTSLGNLGIAYGDLGETDKAIEYLKQALIIAQDISDKGGEGRYLGNLGNRYHDLGKTDKAIEYFKQALAIAREISDKSNEGIWLGNLGLAYTDLGEVVKAIEHLKQALTITREIGDKRVEGYCVGALGKALTLTNKYGSGVEAMCQSLDIADQIQDPRLKSNAASDLAQVYLLHDDLEPALQAIELARQMDVPGNNYNAAALHGVIHLCLDKPVMAQPAFTEAVALADSLLKQPQSAYGVRYARALARAGLALITQASLDESQADYEAALAQCDAQGVLQEQLQLLEQLAQTPNGERLAPLQTLLQLRL